MGTDNVWGLKNFETMRRQPPFRLEGGFADHFRMSGASPNSEGSGSAFSTPTEASNVMVPEELPPNPTGTPNAIGPKVGSSSGPPPKPNSVPPSLRKQRLDKLRQRRLQGRHRLRRFLNQFDKILLTLNQVVG